MDRSNAAKAWWDGYGLRTLPPDQVAARRVDFDAGYASRDAEVYELTAELEKLRNISCPGGE